MSGKTSYGLDTFTVYADNPRSIMEDGSLDHLIDEGDRATLYVVDITEVTAKISTDLSLRYEEMGNLKPAILKPVAATEWILRA